MNKVIVFTELHVFRRDDGKYYGVYNPIRLNQLLNEIFPRTTYERSVFDYAKYSCFPIDNKWKYERIPILIGVGSGANYIEPVGNFDIKFLISPSAIHRERLVDEYKKERTLCLFGGDEKSLKSAEYFREHYKYIITGICDKKLELNEGLEYIKSHNLFERFKNYHKQD